jgi:FAD:protein FMN transferase
MNGSTWTFEAIGTQWQIDLPELAEEARADIKKQITKRIEEFDKNYSRFRDDSLVHEMSVKAGKYTLPEDARPLFDLYFRLYRETAGKFTPLIGHVLEDVGYDAQYSLQSKEVRPTPNLDVVAKYDFPTLWITQPALFDLGAAGKGYLVDIIAGMLDTVSSSSSSYSVDAGGDMKVRMSNDALRIGLEHPDDPTQVVGVVELTHGAICGSAGNRRAWKSHGKEWHHIIDPDALVSPRFLKAVWVTADTALVADALTTCLYFVDPEELRQRLKDYSFEYLIIRADMTFLVSDDFPAELFINKPV